MQTRESLPVAHSDGSEANLVVGLRVFGRYTLRQRLGSGGMGVVWLAHDEKLDRLVALKFVNDAMRLESEVRDDLKRETRRTLELTHPNVIRTYDFVEDEELAAISLEYVNGHTLSQMRLERANRCFEVDELAPWVEGLCRALDYAHHEASTVHRDLKPANLMVTSRGVLKVADFGIAVGLHHTGGQLTRHGPTSGTLRYMSPQQIRGDLPSPADDIYAVGVTLYELVTSKPPFYAGDLSLQIRERVPESMSRRRKDLGIMGQPIPEAWERTIAACLAKDPSERPASAGEIVERLGLSPATVDAGILTVRAVPPPIAGIHSRGDRLRAWCLKICRERKRWVLGMGAICLMLIAGLALRKTTKPGSVSIAQAPGKAVAIAPASPSASAGPPGELVIDTEPSGARIVVGHDLESRSPASMDNVLKPLPAILAVKSNPAGAPFSLLAGEAERDGEEPVYVGETPDEIADLPAGIYRVAFLSDSWSWPTQRVEIGLCGVTDVAVEFPVGVLKVESLPPGAGIFAGEKLLGNAPLEIALPAGPHVITAEFNERESRPREFTLAEGEVHSLRFDFTPGKNSSSASSRSRRSRKKEESFPTKVGRTLKDIFTGKKFRH